MDDSGGAASRTNKAHRLEPLQHSPPFGASLNPQPRHPLRPQHCGSLLAYDRHTALPGLLPLWPHELAIKTKKDHENIIRRLRQALRAERKWGICGHWSYNLTRHDNLAHAYRSELELFATKWGN